MNSAKGTLRWEKVDAFAFLLALAGCQTLEDGRELSTERRLIQAGFVETVDTARFADVPSGSIQKVWEGRKPVYVYKNTKGRVWTGGTQEAVAYQHLLVKERSDRASSQAEQMAIRNRPLTLPAVLP